MNRWLTVEKAGEYIGYSRYKIYKLLRKGLLPVARVDGGGARIDREDLDRLMLSNKISSRQVLRGLHESF